MRRRRRSRTRVPIHNRGVGANLDVMTLAGYHAGNGGLWSEAYRDKGGFSSKKKTKKKCIAWKPVGKGCDCKPVCASYTKRSKGVSKTKAREACERKCSTKRRRTKSRRRR